MSRGDVFKHVLRYSKSPKFIKTKFGGWQPNQQLPTGWKSYQKQNKTRIPIEDIPARGPVYLWVVPACPASVHMLTYFCFQFSGIPIVNGAGQR